MESSRYQPPVRRSLSDEDLAKKVNEATSSHNGMEAVMDLLVAQEALRAQEDAELEAWVEQMEADGSPEAIAALAKFQGKDFTPQTDQLQFAQPEQVEPVAEPEPSEPFNWFSKPDEPEELESSSEVIEADAVVEVIEIIEEVSIPEELTPVGSESPTDFERLLNAASAEEEATALEDDSEIETGPSNLVVPSDEHRNRQPVSQLLVWIGASAVVAPLLLALSLFGFGLSTQSIALDLSVGYLVAGALIATSSLAGKRSGLSTPVISRAVFGVWGNSFPLSFLTVARLILSAVILAVFLFFTDGLSARLLPFDTVLTEFAGIKLTAGYVIGLGVLLFALAASLLRGKTARVTLLVLSLSSFAGLLVSMGGVFQKPLGLTNLGNIGFVSKESLAAIALVIAVQLVLWLELGPNISKAIPMKPRGLKVFFAVLGSQAFVPLAVALLALAYIAPAITSATATGELGPIKALVTSLPSWSAASLVIAVLVSLVYVAILSLKSLSLDLIALLRIRSRVLSTVLSALLVALVLLWFAQQPELRTVEYLLNISVFAAAISAGWIGMFIADVGLRKIAYHELSLTRAYGFYGKFNPISLVLWLSSLGLAVLFVPVNLMGLDFMGYLAPSVGLDDTIGSQALAISAVIFSGMLLTVIARIPQIRKQEQEVLAVESRRESLNDIFIGQE